MVPHPHSAVLLQAVQVQLWQNCPAAKQSQYSLRQRDFLQLQRFDLHSVAPHHIMATYKSVDGVYMKV